MRKKYQSLLDKKIYLENKLANQLGVLVCLKDLIDIEERKINNSDTTFDSKYLESFKKKLEDKIIDARPLQKELSKINKKIDELELIFEQLKK